MKRSEFVRCFHSEEFVAYTRHSPSIVDGTGPCVCAHVKPEGELPAGTSRRADARWIVPVTWAQHLEMHRGEDTFAAKYGLDLQREAREHWRRFTEGDWEGLAS